MNMLQRDPNAIDHRRKYLRGNMARQSFTEIKIDPVAQSAIQKEEFTRRFDDVFKHLNGREKDSTLLLADLREVKKGEIILEPGEVAENIFIVANGKIAIKSDGTGEKTLLPGEVFGESAFLTGGAEPRQTVAASDGEILSIDLKILNTLVRNNSFYHGRLSDCLTRSLQKKWRT